MTDLPRENVQSYPRPPALEPVPQRVVVKLGGALVAKSTRAPRVLETHHAPTYYLPPDDGAAKLIPVAGDTSCEWKGDNRLGGDGPRRRLSSQAAGCEDCRASGLRRPRTRSNARVKRM